MHAMLHTSVLAPHLVPKITSGDRYCRVWMSLVKWCPTQQALPRSAILTEMTSQLSSLSLSPVLDLPRSMSDTLLAKASLHLIISYHGSLL